MGRPRQTATAEGDLKTPPTGGRAEQTSNTARGTLERRRTCGSTLRTPVSAEIAVPLRCGDASKPVGPSDPRRPARPRTFSSAPRPNDSDAKRIARTMEAGLRTAAHTLLRHDYVSRRCSGQQPAALCHCHKNRHKQVPCCIARAKSRLARMQRLRYHSSAIIDEDRKANRDDKKLMAGRHRKLMNMSAGGGQVGRESEKKCR